VLAISVIFSYVLALFGAKGFSIQEKNPVEQNFNEKSCPITQICYMVLSFVKKLTILFHPCKCIDEHVNICPQIMAMIKTCNLGYMC
jgi:hypothetical protein